MNLLNKLLLTILSPLLNVCYRENNAKNFNKDPTYRNIVHLSSWHDVKIFGNSHHFSKSVRIHGQNVSVTLDLKSVIWIYLDKL